MPNESARRANKSLLIERWMSRRVVSLKPLDSVQRARQLIEERRVNQLPVVAKGRLMGIVTDRDVRDASPSVFDFNVFGEPRKARRPPDTSAITVDRVMTRNPLTLTPDDTVFSAAALMRQHRVGALPIVEDGRLVGILTRSDLLAALIGLGARGGA
jgi:acetoin utilization protein AcuB